MESGQRGRGGKKGRKWVDVLCTPVNQQMSWPSQNVQAANAHRQMCSQQMSNWRMSGHPFLMGFFLSKRNRKNNVLTKKHLFDRFLTMKSFPFRGAFRRKKNSNICHQFMFSLTRFFLTKIKTRKSFKTGSENSQKLQEKLTNT